jgi:hypothetical protein
MPAPVLRLVDENGELGKVLPGWTSLSVGGDLGAQQVLSLEYHTGHPTYPLLVDQAEVAVTIGGVEIPDGRFVIDELTDEEVLSQDVVPRSGNSTLFHLNYAIVYPESWTLSPGNTSTPGHGFDGQTPGQALRELLEAAQLRGWLPDLTWDFGDGVDSAGVAWSPTISEFYDQGTDLLSIVGKWTTRKLAVARMNAGVLQLFTYDSSGEDLSLDVQLFRGVDLSEGPVQRTSRNTVSVILGVTDSQEGAGFGVERTDNPAYSKYGRREGFVSQSQIPDQATLQGIVDGTLALKARQREAFTYGLTCAHPKRLPLVHYDRGDQVTLRVAGENRVMRVRQLTVNWDKDGQATGSAAFGDRKMDVEEQLAQRLEQLAGGSIDGGAFGPPLVGMPDTSGEGGGGDVSPDTMPPAPPSGLMASSVPVFNQGSLTAVTTFEWDAPTTNQDGSALQDLSGFEVQYRMGTGGNWSAGGRTDKDTTQAVISRLNVNTEHQARVRAIDIWSNVSSWATLTFTTTNDSIPPAQQPSAPAVSPFLFSGLMVTWDGKAQGGTAIDNDIRHVEVHASTASGFAPSAGTLKDRIDIGGGSTVLGELTPGTTYYVKFRSVDWAGNIGPVSNQASGVPDAVNTGDLADGAVTDLKVASMSATKITAGTLSAVVTLSGEFRTAASGQRVVSNASGIKLYNPAGNVVVNLDAATGEGTFNGVLGAMTVTGYVRVDSGTGPFMVMQNIGGVPTMVWSTGRLIEKYPMYIYTQNNAAGRNLWTSINAPGSQYAASPEGFGYDYSRIRMYTTVFDGDYANATTLPTKMWGTIYFTLPAGNLAGSINGRNPNVRIESKWSLLDSNNFHLHPAIILENGANPQHQVGIRLDHTGSGFNDAELAIVRRGASGETGGLYAALRCGALFWQSSTQFSGRALKTDIGEIPYSALQVIRDNPSQRWAYTDVPDDEQRFHLGPMADDMPEEIRVVRQDGDLGVDTGSMIGLLWKAIEELQEKIDGMEAA